MSENTPQSEVAAALVACQGELEAAAFDMQNPFLKNRYASLGAVISVSRPVLARHGLAVFQVPTTQENHVSLTTTIVHKSGQTMDGGTLTFPIGDEKGKSLAQIVGSLVTYARRYAWSSVLGIYAEEDTDGNDGPQKLAGAIPRRPQATMAPEPPKTSPVAVPGAPQAVPVVGPKYVMQTLNKLQAAPGGVHRSAFRHFLLVKGWIGAEQQPEDWDLSKLPKTAEEYVALGTDFHEFESRLNAEVKV